MALIKDEPQRGKGGKADQKHHGGTVEKELKDMNLTWGEVERMAKNREEWKSLALAICASGCNKD